MSNYGLPLRFKAVDIETGKDVGTNKLIIDPSDGQWYACYGGDTIRFDEEWVTEVQLYQSTGHYDTNSKEIFFGDVVVHINDAGQKELMSVNFLTADGVMLCDINDGFSRLLRRSGVITVIGNIHTPREELERRSKEAHGDE